MKKLRRALVTVACTLALTFLVSGTAVAQQQSAPNHDSDEKPATGSTADAWKQALPQSESTGQTQETAAEGAEESPEQIEKTLTTLEQKWMEAIRLQNSTMLKRILAADFTLAGDTVSDAPVDRDRYLDSVVKEWKLSSYNFDKLTVRLYGGTALVTATYKQQAIISGKDSSGEFLATDVWVQTGKRWHVVARHTTRISHATELK